MVGRIYHVGLTVSDLDRSIAFYRDILGLEFQGKIFMEGEETDKMFRKENCKAILLYIADWYKNQSAFLRSGELYIAALTRRLNLKERRTHLCQIAK